MKRPFQTPSSRIKAAVVFLCLVAVLISSGHAVAKGLHFKLGGARKVPPPLHGVPIYNYAPDGHSEKIGGENLWLLYAEFPVAENSERHFLARKLRLKKPIRK